jgi:hypothetical protein
MSHGGGGATLPLTIPNNNNLANLTFAVQACTFDPASTNGIGAVTNAGIAHVH